uniref:Uncharacterized protein n=1 Tax=Chlamydomonas euryale TaxID=1486919 RepID=A0A7R9Z7P6_9CHLO
MDVAMDALLRRGNEAHAHDNGKRAVLSVMEAEHLIEGLKPMAVEDVGSPKWQAMQQAMEQLNLQAHQNAQAHSDEFVVELFVTVDKVQVLVHNLLALEVWKECVLPHLKKALAEQDPLSSYMLMYGEVAMVNMLEVLLYHQHAVEAIPEEYLLELADWCYRKLQYLHSKEALAYAEGSSQDANIESMMGTSPLQDLETRSAELGFAAAMGSLAVLRYLTSAMGSAPMGLLSRLVSTNDTLMALLPLLDRPPWVRRRKGRTERFQVVGGMRWLAVDAADRLKLGVWEIQAWLAVNDLIVDPKARAKYDMGNWRKERLLGLKRHLNELMFDQLPPLKDLQRVLDEISLGAGGADREQSKQAALILEQVPEVRTRLTAGRDWRQVAITQATTTFRKDAGLDKERIDALAKMLDQMVEMDGPAGRGVEADGTAKPGSGDTAAAGEPSTVHVETRRKVHESGVWEPWSSYELAIDGSRPPDPVEVAGESSGSGNSKAVHGLRYRLMPAASAGTDPLPSNGKIVFRTDVASAGGPGAAPHRRLAEALLKLPDAPLRDATMELPPVVWLTVGLLATDGVVLQLKLKRTDKPTQRDKMTGTWNVYYPVGGALTVKRGLAEELDFAGKQPAPAPSLITPVDTKKSALAAQPYKRETATLSAPSEQGPKAGQPGTADKSSSNAGPGTGRLEPDTAPSQCSGSVLIDENELNELD